MYIGLQHLHSYWAYLALILVVLAVVMTFVGWLGKKEFTAGNKKIALFALIATHIQFLGGVILYVVSPITKSAFKDFGGAMKEASLRLFAVEHPMMMIIGIVLITIGYSRSKRQEESEKKHKQIAIFYLIGIIAILSRIPYSVWF